MVHAASQQQQVWPELPYEAWLETYETLQLWLQIAGKVRLAQTPWLNHSWQVPLYVTSRGLGTSVSSTSRARLPSSWTSTSWSTCCASRRVRVARGR